MLASAAGFENRALWWRWCLQNHWKTIYKMFYEYYCFLGSNSLEQKSSKSDEYWCKSRKRSHAGLCVFCKPGKHLWNTSLAQRTISWTSSPCLLLAAMLLLRWQAVAEHLAILEQHLLSYLSSRMLVKLQACWSSWVPAFLRPCFKSIQYLKRCVYIYALVLRYEYLK